MGFLGVVAKGLRLSLIFFLAMPCSSGATGVSTGLIGLLESLTVRLVLRLITGLTVLKLAPVIKV